MNSLFTFAGGFIFGRYAPRVSAVAAVFVVALRLSTPSAGAGEVHQTVATASSSVGTFEQNIRVSGLMPLIVQAPNADEAFSHTTLNELVGMASLSGHACSGPPGGDLGSGGSAAGNGSLLSVTQFKITSGTLALGAPVFVSLNVGASRRDEGTLVSFDQLGPLNLVQTSAQVQINFAVGGNLYPFVGAFGRHYTMQDGETTFKNGIFDGVDAQLPHSVIGGKWQTGVVPAKVGDFVTIAVNAAVSTSSSAVVGVLATAHAEVALVWGISPFESDVQIVSLEDGASAPSNGDFTLEKMIQSVPPVPPTVMVPEPAAMILGGQALACGLILARRWR